MTVYKCDLCKEIYENKDFMRIQVPMNTSMDATSNRIRLAFKSDVKISSISIEICPKCAIHIADFLDSFGISH